jgi:transcriptional regulator with XRE-family HTH domain
MKVKGDNENMEESIGKRIAALRKELGLNQTKFAERMGVTSQFVSMAEAGKSKFTEANIRLISLTFGVRKDWLEKGEGSMMDDEAALSDKERRLLALFRQLSPRAREILIEYAEKILSDEKILRNEPPEEEEKGDRSDRKRA